MKLNNKGLSVVEVVVTFALIMVMLVGMFSIIMNYREKANSSLKKYELITFKNTLTKDVQDDILKYGVKEINRQGECETLTDLGNCINIVFQDETINDKAFGIGKIDPTNPDTIRNKYLYYDGVKYKLKDTLPETIPVGEDILSLQSIMINDSGILTEDSSVLDDGSMVSLYSIDVYVSYIDFDEDFGIHIMTTNRDISNM